MAIDYSAENNAIFPDAESFAEAADKYFDECDMSGERYSLAGLLMGLKQYGPNHRTVTKETVTRWFNGEYCPYLQGAVHDAFHRIERQIETDERYAQKGMTTYAIFLLKQKLLGGLTDMEKNDKQKVEVVIKHDNSVEESDFQ